MSAPYIFDEFFASGQEESVSPFLTRRSQRWGKNIPIKSSLTAAFFLALSFGFSFTEPLLAKFFLSFVFFLSGVPALLDALEDLRNLEINIDVLMTLAALLAVLIGSTLEGALLLVLFEISGALEGTVSRKARSALHHLNRIAPKLALLVADDGTTYEKAIREITPGMRILIKSGEVVPLDGIIKEGVSSVNLVHLTGEAMPIPKEAGDEVPAGARNLDSALIIEVSRTMSDSTVTRIIQLITQAQSAKPRMQRFLDRFGRGYATTIIALTVLFALLLPLFFSISYLGMEGSIYRAVAFLIAASPCALIIATPTAYLSAMSACSRKGILLKGGVTLDALASCQTVAFDKTGTLTTGDLICTSLEPLDPAAAYSIHEALGIAASLERQVVHPIASAIVRLARDRLTPSFEITQFQSIPGYGLQGMINGNTPVAIGLPEHILKTANPDSAKKIHSWGGDEPGQILTLLSIGGELFVFRFSDQVREQIPALIKTLRTRNQLEPIILTGDNENNARHVGHLLGIETIYANLRPENKLSKVSEIAENRPLAMIGDGINDAPALARATVGISMGRIGSATAVDASDVVLLNDDLHLLSWLFSKSRFTQRIVKQNIALALAIICFATTPALIGLIPLWLAVILHEGGTVIVGLNSLRLLKG